jgi:hypothetical protein
MPITRTMPVGLARGYLLHSGRSRSRLAFVFSAAVSVGVVRVIGVRDASHRKRIHGNSR